MTTLHDRLADLAAHSPDAPFGHGHQGGELWERGLRFHRRRRTGTAVVVTAAVLALIALGSVTWLRSPAAVEPLPADSPGGMPDRIFAASEWLPETDGHPLGQLAAAYPSIRHRFGLEVHRGDDSLEVSLDLAGGYEHGVVGVSATTGEYRFLDLPGLVENDDSYYGTWSLAPDGRYVVYLYAAAGGDLARGAGSGVAIYDTRTGVVRRHPVKSERGIQLEQFFWTSPGTVVAAYGLVDTGDHDDGNYSTKRGVYPLVVDVDQGTAHDLVTMVRTFGVSSAGPGFVVMETLDGYVEVDPATGTILRDLGKHAPHGVWDPSGTRAADGETSSGGDVGFTPVELATLPATPGGKLTREHIPTNGVKVFSVYSWLDEDHLAVLEVVGETGQGLRVSSLDIHSATTRPLVTVSNDNVDTQLATALLTEPTVPGIEPPTPVDPRKVTGLGVGIVVAAAVALIMWRRRVRP